MHVNHHHGFELFECRSGRQPRRMRAQHRPQGHVQAIRQEGQENVRFDPILPLVINRSQRQVAFEVPEGFLHLRELHVELPEPRRLITGQVGAQQIPPFPPPDLPQLVFAQGENEFGFRLGHGDFHQARTGGILLLGGAHFFHQRVAFEFHAL